MVADPITCNGILPDGRYCDLLATVVKVRYIYDRRLTKGSGPSYVLKQLHYDAVCPVCGERRIVSKAVAV
jgi:hypothetical protein